VNCCRNPMPIKAYAPCKPFQAKYCSNCGEVELATGPILAFIWKYFVWPFWDGRILVLNESDD